MGWWSPTADKPDASKRTHASLESRRGQTPASDTSDASQPCKGAARGYRVSPPRPSDATDHQRPCTPDNHQGMAIGLGRAIVQDLAGRRDGGHGHIRQPHAARVGAGTQSRRRRPQSGCVTDSIAATSWVCSTGPFVLATWVCGLRRSIVPARCLCQRSHS